MQIPEDEHQDYLWCKHLRTHTGIIHGAKSSRMSVGFSYGESPKGNHWDFLPHKIPKDEGWDYPWCELPRTMAVPADTSHPPAGPLKPSQPQHQGMCFPPSSSSIPWRRSACIHAPGKLHNFPQSCRHRIWFCVHPAQPGRAGLGAAAPAEVCPLHKGHRAP